MFCLCFRKTTLSLTCHSGQGIISLEKNGSVPRTNPLFLEISSGEELWDPGGRWFAQTRSRHWSVASLKKKCLKSLPIKAINCMKKTFWAEPVQERTWLYNAIMTFFTLLLDCAKNFESSVERAVWLSSLWRERWNYWYYCVGQRCWQEGWFYWQVCAITAY